MWTASDSDSNEVLVERLHQNEWRRVTSFPGLRKHFEAPRTGQVGVADNQIERPLADKQAVEPCSVGDVAYDEIPHRLEQGGENLPNGAVGACQRKATGVPFARGGPMCRRNSGVRRAARRGRVADIDAVTLLRTYALGRV